MGIDLTAISAAVAAHGRVARVVIAEIAGSSPREVGAAMLVWREGDSVRQSGTIGGGALEYQAAARALETTGLSRHALGPELGQCCGGAVTLLTEHFDAARLHSLQADEVLARPTGAQSDKPLAVQRCLDRARAQGTRPEPQLIQGWMIEPVEKPQQDLWIWGAGHVGRALVNTLHPLPDFAITWVDTAQERFPEQIPANVTQLPARAPHLLMPHAPKTAAHLILTYSHELDFQLCHAALSHGFSFAGLIGSDTKWARFRKRLTQLGHDLAQIQRITCPIGQKSLGKHPQAIAIGVAAQLVTLLNKEDTACRTHSSASTG
ncbi:xanthine dehydrogenase accessory protein XdhC [Tropicibacter sp. R15_0]|uniref:xanthine dehydrogenase accessory protein XdhC n=1 Tax=Tropicibacter sp. R15_0 TaxID=2821101 RepID=UPI001AD955FC|nr:xanthine dehydrogenase accessory protein XdhC [Tropicibacter sp. R15_0]MBO9465680.1 xanthine dehydrogenase accessory protein XdhC [Tropicibacter sp. R15_0]